MVSLPKLCLDVSNTASCAGYKLTNSVQTKSGYKCIALVVHSMLKAGLHGTTLSHVMCLQQVYDTSCFV